MIVDLERDNGRRFSRASAVLAEFMERVRLPQCLTVRQNA
jgi:hypothetical protein